MEMHTRLYDLRVVHHHKCSLGQMKRQVAEHILPHYTFIIYEQLRLVALCQWELGYALVGQRIVVFVYSDMLRIHIFRVLATKVRISENKTKIFRQRMRFLLPQALQVLEKNHLCTEYFVLCG